MDHRAPAPAKVSLGHPETGALLLTWTGPATSPQEAEACARRALSACYALSERGDPEGIAARALAVHKTPIPGGDEELPCDSWFVGKGVPKPRPAANAGSAREAGRQLAWMLTGQTAVAAETLRGGDWISIDGYANTGPDGCQVHACAFAYETGGVTHRTLTLPRPVQEALLATCCAIVRAQPEAAQGMDTLWSAVMLPEESATLAAARRMALAADRPGVCAHACGLLRRLGAADLADALEKELSA